MLCQIVSGKYFVTMAFHKYTFITFLLQVYCIMRQHLALAVRYNLVFWNDNVYWIVIGKWCHLKNLGLEIFLGRIQVLWRNFKNSE